MLRASHYDEGLCYTNPRWRRQVALNMLGHAYRIFAPTSRIKKVELLAAKLNTRTDRQRFSTHQFLTSLDVAVVDAFRIAACFENLFKARLLLSGWVIHQVIKDAQPTLALQQRKHPIKVSSIKKAEGLTRQRDIGYVFTSLSPHTLRWSTLVQESDYRATINLPDRLFDALKPFAIKRNTLHFLAQDVSIYNTGVVDDLRYIRTSFNRLVVRHHNRLVKQLEFPEIHFRSEI